MKKRAPKLMVVASLGLLLTSCAQKAGPQSHATAATTRVPTSQDEESPWTTWSKKGTVGGLLVLRPIREKLLHENLHDPHVDYKGYAPIDCSKQDIKVRSADGSCYLPETPHVGASNTAFGRNVPPEYIDKDAKANLMNPNPKLISEVFFTRDEFRPVPFLNMLAASWIQFMNHDWLTHGKNSERNPHQVEHNGKTYEIERTKSHEIDMASFKSEYQKVSMNEVTHWWDASQLYGSNQDEQNKVRSFAKGRLTTVKVNGRELLPKDTTLNAAYNKQNLGAEVTGFRDNMWAGLSMLHHLFVLEHNAIADMLVKKYARFDSQEKKYIWDENGVFTRLRNRVTKTDKGVKYFTDKELDEHVFQRARLINAAVLAKIHTVEWTPAILANKTLKKAMFANWYGLANPQTWSRVLKHIPGLNKTEWFKDINEGYLIGGIVGQKMNNYGVPFTITEEFTSVYRLHSLLPENLEIKKAGVNKTVESLPLASTRNEKSYETMASHDLKDLFYSFGTQNPGQLVLNNFPKFMQEFTIPGLGTMDLAMVDVMRDRERGVPRYNQFRRAIGLKPIRKYSDFFLDGKALTARQKDILQKFNTVYGKDENGNDNVEMIDLLVGTSAEEVRPKNFGFGETMFQIFIVMASRRLMADPFFTDKYTAEYYTKAGLDYIDTEGWMHKVIVRHMPELKRHVDGIETAFNPWKP